MVKWIIELIDWLWLFIIIIMIIMIIIIIIIIIMTIMIMIIIIKTYKTLEEFQAKAAKYWGKEESFNDIRKNIRARPSFVSAADLYLEDCVINFNYGNMWCNFSKTKIIFLIFFDKNCLKKI